MGVGIGVTSTATLCLEALAQLVQARTAARSSAAAPTDLFDRARAVVDDRVDIAIRRRVTGANDHLKLIMHFKKQFVKMAIFWPATYWNSYPLNMIQRVVGLLLALTACKQGDHVPDVAPPDLQLVSAGNEPRQLLRYHAAKGASEKLELAIELDVSAGSVQSPMPTLVFALSLGVEDVLPDGRMKLRTTITDATARARDESNVVPGALGNALKGLDGIVIASTLSPAGRMTQTTVDTRTTPEAIKTQLAALTSSFGQVTMTLPDEPVGVGAIWRSARPIEQSGMKLKAVNTITVTALDGAHLGFTVDTQVHGGDQSVKQDDVTVEIKDIVGTGTGKGTIDLATLATTSELSAELRSEMTATGESAATPMRMKMTTSVRSL